MYMHNLSCTCICDRTCRHAVQISVVEILVPPAEGSERSCVVRLDYGYLISFPVTHIQARVPRIVFKQEVAFPGKVCVVLAGAPLRVEDVWEEAETYVRTS